MSNAVKSRKTILLIAIFLTSMFFIYFNYFFNVESFSVLKVTPLPLTADDIEKGYSAKYVLVINHTYGSVTDLQQEYITLGVAEFNSTACARKIFEYYLNNVWRSGYVSEYNISFRMEYIDNIIMDNNLTIEIFKETPINSKRYAYMFVLLDKNRVIEGFLKDYEKEKIIKIVKWVTKKLSYGI